ncbi:AMP-binding protein [Massilia sp. MB5]|uniref:AMP-binding protein n=1 Tax=Massilia sp. MB5 TaxID=2919578 RepID=UPI001F0F1BC3|nr:AMP-binding protein [Massilia sp. MB5]UMR33410.1 AMP-binding protein [Massilia sp. MB5]
MLAAILAAPGQPIGTLPLTSTADQALLAAWAGQAQVPCTGWTFESFGERTALTSPQARLSYAELDRRCGQLATLLRARGAGPERVVAIRLADGLDTAVAILAAWRAEAAFVYLDPALPPSARRRSWPKPRRWPCSTMRPGGARPWRMRR